LPKPRQTDYMGKLLSGNICKAKILFKPLGWKLIFRLFNKKEKVVFFILLLLLFASLFTFSLNFYYKNTEIQPNQGGVFVEGLVGQPRFVNPVYSKASDIDEDLTELVFSGLFKYNAQGEIVPDLAKNYSVKEGGRVYEVYLKDNLFWSDGKPLSADDIIFTVNIIQNLEYKSPQLVSWLGVEAERISDEAVRFRLKNPYAPFLETLTQKIIPEHIWKDISPQNFALTINNLKPVGSGPYSFKGFEQDKEGNIVSYRLKRNDKYYGKKPYIEEVVFRFFENEKDLIKSYQKGEIDAFSLKNPADLEVFQSLKDDGGNLSLDGGNLYSFVLPRYFAVFFKPKECDLLPKEKKRKALNYGANRKEIIKEVLSGWGEPVYSPVLPQVYGLSGPEEKYEYNPSLAQELLEKADFLKTESGKRIKIIKKENPFQFDSDLKKGDKGAEVENLQKCLAKDPEIYPEGEVSGYFGQKTKEAVIKFQEKYAQDILLPFGLRQGTGLVSKKTREKLNELCYPEKEEVTPLKISLKTVNQPVLIKVAELLKKQWQELGIETEIKSFESAEKEKVIKERDYQTLLFGEALTMIPDPFPFWHSNQKIDPGLNLAVYESKKADKLLEEIRQNLDPEKRKERLQELQNVILEDAPAVFLYQPDYLYLVSKKVKGIDIKMVVGPSKRFSEIEDWYIKTKREWK